MSLDERQLQVVKHLAREVTNELQGLKYAEAAERCEGIAIVLSMIGAEKEAELARHLSCLLGEGRVAHKELSEMLLRLA